MANLEFQAGKVYQAHPVRRPTSLWQYRAGHRAGKNW